MWDLPRPGLEPVSPALAGGLSTTAPPGKPHSFLLMNNIPLYKYTSFYLSIHQLMNIWFISTFWLFWKTMLWTFMYKFLCGYTFSFLSSIYLGIELLGHMVTLCLTARLFSKVKAPFYIPSSSILKGFQFLHILINICYSLFVCLIITIPVCVKWYLTEFYLHFPDDQWCWKSYHVLIGHMYILFGEISIQILCLFFNWDVCLFVVEL